MDGNAAVVGMRVRCKMDQVRTLLQWFTGGDRHYMPLTHCMSNDWFWIGLTVALDLAVWLGYLLIAAHWWRNEKSLPEGPPKQALRSMKWLFVICGLCGYVFIPIKLVWPAWRLYDLVLMGLAFATWRYAWNARDLKVVYNELKRNVELERGLEETRATARMRTCFLNAISHDLRTPLNGLLLHAELAELHVQGGEHDHILDDLEQIKRCTRTAADLLNGFLELGRLDWTEESVEVETFDVAESLASVRAQIGPRADAKHLSIRVKTPPGLRLRSDRVKLERILLNLLDNAVKFTEQGSVEIAVEVTPSRFQIHVTDTGAGIDPALEAVIFDDFFQVHNRERDSSKGFGLGLGIARRLAARLGGELLLDSRPGRGSRFSLTLPHSLIEFGHEPSGPRHDIRTQTMAPVG